MEAHHASADLTCTGWFRPICIKRWFWHRGQWWTWPDLTLRSLRSTKPIEVWGKEERTTATCLWIRWAQVQKLKQVWGILLNRRCWAVLHDWVAEISRKILNVAETWWNGGGGGSWRECRNPEFVFKKKKTRRNTQNRSNLQKSVESSWKQQKKLKLKSSQKAQMSRKKLKGD